MNHHIKNYALLGARNSGIAGAAKADADAEAIRELVEPLAVEGYSLQGIADQLNAWRVGGPRGEGSTRRDPGVFKRAIGGNWTPLIFNWAARFLHHFETGSLAGGVTSQMASDEQLQTLRVFPRRRLSDLSESLTKLAKAHILDALKLAVVRMQAAATCGATLNFH